MSKINKGYMSLYRYFVYKLPELSVLQFFDRYFYANESDANSWNPHHYGQLIGGLQPIADIYKDLIDTFKPYKSRYYIRRDFFQPIIGLKNILKGLFNLIVAPLLFIINTVRYACISGSFKNFIFNMRLNVKRTASWLAEGIGNIIRGALQIVTSPLTWLLRMPLRGLVTLIKGKPKIEQNPGLQRCVKIDIQNLCSPRKNTSSLSHSELHRKFLKSISRGQTSVAEPHAELDQWNQYGDPDHESSEAHQYFCFFRDNIVTALGEKAPKIFHSSIPHYRCRVYYYNKNH